MDLPVTVTRIQNRRGTQAEFDSLYPAGYNGTGGVSILEYPGILLPGELALCTDTRSVYVGNINGEYVKIGDGIANIELLPLSLVLYPISIYAPIPELEFSPSSFFNIDYSLFDTSTLNWNSPGTNLARNGTLEITGIFPSSTNAATLTETYTEVNNFGEEFYISFRVEYSSDNNSMQLFYKHNFPAPLKFNTSTKSWIPFVTSIPPVLVSISPDRGSAFGGTPVTVTGENFLDLISLTFNGLPAIDINVIDDSTISAITPPGITGPVSVEIITLAGTDTKTLFEYISVWPSVLDSEISGPPGSSNYGFSKDTDIFNNTVVAGMPDAQVGLSTNAGRALVYEKSGPVWVGSELAPSVVNANGQFGYSVAIFDDTIVVGEPGYSSNQGSAHVFRKIGTEWIRTDLLVASDTSVNSLFGHSVDIYGDTIVIGAKGKNGDTGAVYVFRLSDGNWVQDNIITATDSSPGSNFGKCSIYEDTLAVGAETANGTGATYVFYRSGGVWGQQAKLIPEDASIGDLFGHSVSVYGNTVVAGSPNDNTVGSASGSAYVFIRQNTTWEEQTRLVGSGVSFGDQFGFSVEINENIISIGAPFDDADNEDYGSVYVFTREGTSWTEQEILQPGSIAQGDFFGYSVSLDAGNLAVGSPYADGSELNSGKVFIYKPL